MRTKNVIISCVLFAIIIIALSAAFCFYLIHATLDETPWYPGDGRWYCQELGIMLSFDDDSDSYIIHKKTGGRIQCAWISNPGTERIGVYCQESDAPWELGESVFIGEYVRQTDTELTLRDYDTGEEYAFLRYDE